MSVEKLAETVGEVVERRSFLKRTGAATLGLLGLSSFAPAAAKASYDTHGCTLCNPPGNCGPRLECSWCWQGACYAGHWYYCCEGRQAGGNCNSPSCPAYCSWYTGPWGTC
jgi:hypothetical protein